MEKWSFRTLVFVFPQERKKREILDGLEQGGPGQGVLWERRLDIFEG